MSASKTRIVFSGPALKRGIKTGAKRVTCRPWTEAYAAVYRRRCKEGTLVRAQTNRAHSSIFGWLLITFITPRGCPWELVTDEVRELAGCKHLTQDEYIHTYCLQSDGTVADGIVVIHLTYYPIAVEYSS